MNFLQGQLFINGFNVGRYWPTAGPQVTLYIPAGVLYASPRQNHIVILELEKCPTCTEPTFGRKRDLEYPSFSAQNVFTKKKNMNRENKETPKVKIQNPAFMFEPFTESVQLNAFSFVDKPIISGQCFSH